MTMAIVTLYLGWSAGLVSYWFRAAVWRRVKRGGRRGVVLLQVYVRLVHPDDALVGNPVGLPICLTVTSLLQCSLGELMEEERAGQQEGE